MAESYEDYEQEYNACLSRIRSFLASSTRSRTTLQECERLLGQAKQYATAMQGLAEVEGNTMKIREASQKIERDIGPLTKEVVRALHIGGEGDNNSAGTGFTGGREELFAQAPGMHGRDYGYNSSSDMESLIGSSEDMLRQSLSLAMETEQIGTTTMEQMGRQREQLQGANANIIRTRQIAEQASSVLLEMSRKAFQNKLFLYLMVALLIFGNFWALSRLFRKS
mmetsp:Transcript_23129/g.24646  ORF Transcript_23129/g.24646 Transcript_23129/m.24646 type:complete len:224 (+) Transcript_23129:58-729(+)